MAVQLPLKPFPSPVPRRDKLIDPNVVRSNDNLNAQGINQVYDLAFANAFLLMGA